MTELDKFRVVNTLKHFMVRHQYYEISIYLRDLEKTTYKEYTINRDMCDISKFSPSDYHFAHLLIDMWQSSKTTNEIDTRDYDSIRGLLDVELLHVIRQIKIDGILE